MKLQGLLLRHLAVALVALGCPSCSSSDGEGMGMPDAPPDAARIVCQGGTTLGGSHYLVTSEMLNRDDAISQCSAMPGFHLVTFETLAEISAVRSLVSGTEVWTGISQSPSATAASDGWANRALAQPSPLPTPFPWSPGEPNDSVPANTTSEGHVEDFCSMNADGTFNDALSSSPKRVLCECTPTP